jgi:hypothetical protein
LLTKLKNPVATVIWGKVTENKPHGLLLPVMGLICTKANSSVTSWLLKRRNLSPLLRLTVFSEIREELARLTALVEKAANAPAQPPAKPQFSGQYVTVVADQKRGYVVRGKHAPKSVIFDTEDLAFANLVASRIDNFVATRER